MTPQTPIPDFLADPRVVSMIKAVSKESAKEASEEVVDRVMTTLGININDPDHIRRFHSNQSLLETIGSWGGKIGVAAVIGIVGLIISVLGTRIAGGGGQ